MKKIALDQTAKFNEQAPKLFVLHESEYFKLINFNFRAGQTLPIHSHDIEGQLSITVISGEGKFLAEGGKTLPAKAGDILISDIAEKHGIRAETEMRVVVTIAPPI